jgi:hypothetical protein
MCGKKTGKWFVISHSTNQEPQYNEIPTICHNCKAIHFTKPSEENNYQRLPITMKAMEVLRVNK